MTQHGRHLISRWLTVARAGCAAGLLVLGAIAAVPTGAAASAPPVGTEISLRSERDVCTGVPGPAPCVYLSFTLHNGADADHYFVCVYRAYHQPGEFWDEYQQVCTDIPADRVIVDTKKWQSVKLLPTTLTFTEGEPEEFVLAAEVTTDVLPYRGSGGDKRQDGACVQQTQLHYVSGATSTILTIDGQRFDLPGGLFGAKVVDHGRCRPGTSSAVGPKTTSTLISASVFPCQDYPEGATCVEHSINVYDGFFEPDTYDVCLTVYTYPLGTGEAGSQESRVRRHPAHRADPRPPTARDRAAGTGPGRRLRPGHRVRTHRQRRP